MISHEAPLTAGFGAEIAATVQVYTHYACNIIHCTCTVALLYCNYSTYIYTNHNVITELVQCSCDDIEHWPGN